MAPSNNLPNVESPKPTTPKATAKPRIAILATGGTIAGSGSGGYGYAAGALEVQDLLDAVPGLDEIARLSGEQIANIGSQDMNDAIWLELARRTNATLAESDVRGVVITHGTDTMEETAYFLSLVVKSDQPVVFVGSMRPATAIGADGPANLFNAVATAIDPGAIGRGVVVAMNDKIHFARNVTKSKTTALDTFTSPDRGPAGVVHSGVVRWFAPLEKKHTTATVFSIDGLTELPVVEIVYAHSNLSTTMVKAMLSAGMRGIIVAGMGNGNMPQATMDVLARAVKNDHVVVVRSTRLESGIVLRNNEVDDDALGFVASGELNPAKARPLLQLALTKTTDPATVQRMFDTY